MTIFIEFLVFILIILLVYIIFSNIFGKQKKIVKGDKIKILFKKLDEKYNSFLKKNVDNVFLTSDNYKNEINKLIDLSFTILKPEIKSIYTIVKLSSINKIKIDYNSEFFESNLAISEALYNRNFKINRLTEKDESNFYNSFKESIKADLMQKLYKDGFDIVNQSTN